MIDAQARLFERARALIEDVNLRPYERARILALLREMRSIDPIRYEEEWIERLALVSRARRAPLAVVEEIEELELASRLAPFALFELHLSADAYETEEREGREVGQIVDSWVSSPLLARVHTMSLYVDGIDEGAPWLARLADNPHAANLVHLRVGGNGITADWLACFRVPGVLPALKGLDLSDNPLGPSGAEALASGAIPRGLNELDLSRCGLGDEGVAALSGADAGDGALERLALQGNGLTERGASCAAALAASRRLERLDLSENPIGDRGVARLADSELGDLRELILRRVGAGALAARALASSDGLDRLVSLDLFGNQIGEEGVRALLDAAFISRLEALNLQGNHLPIVAEQCLASSPLLRESIRSEWAEVVGRHMAARADNTARLGGEALGGGERGALRFLLRRLFGERGTKS